MTTSPATPTPVTRRWPRWAVVLVHVAGWMTLLVLMRVLAFRGSVSFVRLPDSPNDVRNLLSFLLLVGFAYANHLVLVPRLYFGPRRWRYYLAAIGALVFIIGLPQLLPLEIWMGAGDSGTALPDRPRLRERRPLLYEAIQRRRGRTLPLVIEESHFVLIYLVSVLGSITILSQARLRTLERDRYEAELATLRAQIQPHFLFNTLNSLYALAIGREARLARAILQLSDFLRHVTAGMATGTNSLRAEVDYLRNYVELQRLRLPETVEVRFSENLQDARTPKRAIGPPQPLHGPDERSEAGRERAAHPAPQIASLLLMTVVENAFKHGTTPEAPCFVHVSLHWDASSVLLEVGNSKVVRRTPPAGTGLGLSNLRTRLTRLYPGRHTLCIEDGVSRFDVSLSIQLPAA